jgi:hypothetical protein
MQQRHGEADRIYETVFERLRTSNVVSGELRREYGLMLLRRGDAAGAETQLLQSLASLELAYKDYVVRRHPNIEETHRALMTLYGKIGKPALVEHYRVPPGRFVPY